jgi:simple sugar transport system permease protein
MLVQQFAYDSLKNQSLPIDNTAVIPPLGLDKIFPGSSVNGGIIIAIAACIAIYFVLNKTKFGYELKAVGFNRDASKYAGINEKRTIVMAIMIAGALSGLGGGVAYLAGSGKHIEVLDVLAADGFTGITVALLGLSNPVGIIFTGIFIGYITVGGFYMQLYNFVPEIINIITAMIIYFSAFALVIQTIINRRRNKL